jgi:hypothetical protein
MGDKKMKSIPCPATPELIAEITELWNCTAEDADFGADLYERKYLLAIADRRHICIVDRAGDAYRLTELLQGETRTSMRNRLLIPDLDRWINVDEAKRQQRGQIMPRRNVGLRFHIDTNRINARQNLPYMNQLEKWSIDDVIILDMSEQAYDEARSGSKNIKNRLKKTAEYIFMRANDVFGGEEGFRDKMRLLLFDSTSLNKGEEMDVRILFCAKMAGAILITDEGASKQQRGGMLGHAKELSSLYGIEVMRDDAAVQRVRHRIILRDKTARSVERDTGLPLPPWVGQD